MNFSDLAPFYADFGVDAVHTPKGGSPKSGRVLFDQPGTAIVGGEIIATDYAVRYPAVTFQPVVRGDQFVVCGQSFVAREAAQPATLQGDELIVPLARAA